MLVSDIESTPNMNSFLLRLDTPLADVAGVSGVRGRTFRAGGEACPESLASVLRVDGVDSVYAMESALTVNKRASATWPRVLSEVLPALGGATEALLADPKLLGALGAVSAPASAKPTGSSVGGVTVRLQVSCGMPIQVEAVGSAGLAPAQRAKLM